MQPRHRSKWRAAVGPHSSSPSLEQPHQMDPAAGRVRLVAPEPVRRAGRKAEPAMDAGVHQLPGRGLSHRTPPPPAARGAATLGSAPLLHVGVEDAAGRRPTMRVAPAAQVVDRRGYVGGERRWAGRPAASSRCSAHSSSSSTTISPPTSVRASSANSEPPGSRSGEHAARRPGVLDAGRRERLSTTGRRHRRPPWMSPPAAGAGGRSTRSIAQPPAGADHEPRQVVSRRRS